MDSKRHDDGMPEARPPEDRAQQRSVTAPASPTMKLWVVYPGDPQEPPFHFSNTPNVMLIAAPDADYARRLATNEAADMTWQNKDRVHVDEYRPTTPMVLTRDLKG